MTSERTRLRAQLAPAALLSVLLLAQCTTHEDGIAVDVGVARSKAADADGGAAAESDELTTDLGYRVRLQHAYLVLSRVELLPCTQARLWPALRSLLGTQVAYAHGFSTPTVWAVPQVLDLLDTSSRIVSVARMQPPPDDYCQARIWIDVADADAVALPADVPMVGHSIALEGSFAAPDESAWHPFRYVTSGLDHVDLSFVNGEGKTVQLSLSSSHLRAEVHLELGYRAILDGLELVDGDYEPLAASAVRNVLSHARAMVLARGTDALDATRAPGDPVPGALR